MTNDGWTKDRALDISVVLLNGDEEIYLDEIVKSVTWSGDVQQASRQLEVALSNTTDGIRREFNIEKGGEISFRSEGEELFRGIVVADKIDIKGQMSLTAYDENFYLTKSKDSKRFVSKTATQIIASLCEEFGVPYGAIEDTGFVIPKLILRDKSIWEMIVTALTITYRQTGRRFFVFSKQGKLYVSERKNVVARIRLERGLNILGAEYSSTMEEMKTRVKVVGEQEITVMKDGEEAKDKQEITAEAEDPELINRFGILQHLESMSGDVTPSEIQQRANELLAQLAVITDDARLDCLGEDSVLSGGAIYAYEPMTGIIGSFYVSSDSHTYANGLHTMAISLSATDDLPLMEYEPPEEPEEKAKKAKKPKDPKKSKKSETDIVDLIFNAKGVG